MNKEEARSRRNGISCLAGYYVKNVGNHLSFSLHIVNFKLLSQRTDIWAVYTKILSMTKL